MDRLNGAAAVVAGDVLSLPNPEALDARKELPLDLLEKLKAPLPPQAVSPNTDKPGLSAIKVIYVVERLNEAFGLNGWHIANEVVEKGAMVVVKSTLTINDYGIRIEQYGGNANSDRGDAYKGACTDTLSKCASYIGIGMDVYKGLRDERVPNNGNVRSGDGPEAHAHRAVASLTTKNMAERFSTLRTVLGAEEGGPVRHIRLSSTLFAHGTGKRGGNQAEPEPQDSRRTATERKRPAQAGPGCQSFSMHGGQVTREAMNTTAARSRRRFRPAASQFKCRTILKGTAPAVPSATPECNRTAADTGATSSGGRRAVRDVQQFAFSF